MHDVRIYYTVSDEFSKALMGEDTRKKLVISFSCFVDMPDDLAEYCDIVFNCMNIKDSMDATPFMLGVRSMSVGDVVEIDGRAFLCCSVGWKEGEIERSRIFWRFKEKVTS